MRFKGTNLKGEVIYGGLYSGSNKTSIVVKNDRDILFWNLSNPNYAGFYTGLKDENGYKIYTNDYIKINNKEKGIVKFYEGRCIVITDTGFFDLNSENIKNRYETLGNVMQYHSELSDVLKNLLITVREEE